MYIALDAMGGDYAPAYAVEGAVLAARELGIGILLVGDTDKVKAELDKHAADSLPIEIVHASEYILMEETTLDAMRSKRDSSIRVAARLVKEGRANGLVSA
ncbi:MAG: phosphate acyltransferase, partial [Chlorobiales bacterium]|nr:phosphate acyltransferase [Chlorobiales bacterium]